MDRKRAAAPRALAAERTEPSRKDVSGNAESVVPAPLGIAHWRNAHSALTAALNLTADAVYFVSLEDMRICAANVAATSRTGYHAASSSACN